jgi:hypothetical protein
MRSRESRHRFRLVGVVGSKQQGPRKQPGTQVNSNICQPVMSRRVTLPAITQVHMELMP